MRITLKKTGMGQMEGCIPMPVGDVIANGQIVGDWAGSSVGGYSANVNGRQPFRHKRRDIIVAIQCALS